MHLFVFRRQITNFTHCAYAEIPIDPNGVQVVIVWFVVLFRITGTTLDIIAAGVAHKIARIQISTAMTTVNGFVFGVREEILIEIVNLMSLTCNEIKINWINVIKIYL